jgi:hypothetical protein
MKTPVFSVVLAAIALVCTPQAAVLAKEATVVQFRLHGTYEAPLRTPLGHVCSTGMTNKKALQLVKCGDVLRVDFRCSYGFCPF